MDIFSNILDPIRDSLDPDVFDDASGLTPRLKATIASWVKNKVYAVLQANGYKDMEEWLTLILTGSLTTYQWAEDSDFDVSLWCSLDKFEEFDRATLIAIVLEQLDGHIVPGTTHPLQVFVVDVTQVKGYNDSYQPGVRSAYSLDKMEWMVPPERDRVHDVKKEYPDVFNSALQAASKMRSLLQYQPESARAYWKYLHKRRRSDMKAGRGDYSDSNIVYKMLHNAGLFDTIQKELGVHIAKAVLAESNMVDVEDVPADQDPLAAAAGNTLVGPSIAPKARPSGQVRKSHDEDESGNPLEPHVHFEDLEDEFGDEPIIDVPDDISGIENISDETEDAEAKYEAYEHDDQNIPNPMTLAETKAHFKKHHGMDIDMFKQMMPDQFAQMTGGYDLAANPDIEEEIFRVMHGEIHNPNSPYAQMMKWNHAHPESEQREARKIASRLFDDKIAQAKCRECNGVGVIGCPECDRDQDGIPTGKQDGDDCFACDGSTAVSCPSCDGTKTAKIAQTQPLDGQLEWLDLVLHHDLSVDQIPSDLHTHPKDLDESEIPAHVLKEHGYIPNTSELGAAHKALHDGRRMHWLYNNLSTQGDSN